MRDVGCPKHRLTFTLLYRSITLPPIVYIPYLGLNYTTVLNIALTRSYDVLIG